MGKEADETETVKKQEGERTVACLQGNEGWPSETAMCLLPQLTSWPPGMQSRRTSDASKTRTTGGAKTAPMIMQPLLTSDHSLPNLDLTASRASSSDANTSTPLVHVCTMCPDDWSNAMI